MTEQTIDIQREKIPKMPYLSRSKDHVTNVSYALIPKEAKVVVEKEKIIFKFKYPITEDDIIERSFDYMGIKYFLEKTTKKILAIEFVENLLTTSKLADFDKSLRYLRKEQIRESVKQNYNLIHEIVHFFFDEIKNSQHIKNIDKPPR